MSLMEEDPVLTSLQAEEDAVPGLIESSSSEPTPEELAPLSRIERIAFRVAHRMNQGAWKKLWTACQKTVGAGWIRLSTYNIMRVYGLEHVEATDHRRPLVLVSNHRSFFDMYAVSATLFHRTRWQKKLFFPVRARFFYESPAGMLVNFIMGWWSMYPPIFMVPEKRLFDKYSLRRLTDLCRNGEGHLIGFHPEGTRNKSSDPYSFLRPQPGIGRLVKEANPQVVPVFVAGLNNSLPKQVIGNWTNGELIRIHFGPQMDFSEYADKRDHLRTYKEIADHVMAKIAELAEQDRQMHAQPDNGRRQ